MNRLALFALILATLSQTGIDYGSGTPMMVHGAKRHASYMFTGTSGTGIESTALTRSINVIANNGLEATQARADSLITTPGWIQDLEVLLGADIGTSGDDVTVTLRVNNVNSVLACTVEGEDVGDQLVCTTGIDHDRVRVVAWDRVRYQVQTFGTPAANVFLSVRATFIPDLPNVSPLTGNLEPATTGVRYGAMVGHNKSESTLLEAATLFPRDGVISDLMIEITAAPGAGSSYTFELIDGTGASFSPAVSCIIADSATTCQDPEGDSVIVSAGDIVSLSSTPSVSPAPSFRYGHYGATFTSTTQGFVIASVSDETKHLTAGQRDVISGVDGFRSSSNERSQQVVGRITVTDMYAEFATAPGAAASGDQYNIQLIVNTTATGMECVIAETATTCNDTGKNLTYPVGVLNNGLFPASSPTGRTGATLISYAARIPW